MAKDTFKGEEGVWRTLPNGVHIFIADGETLEHAMERFDESQWGTHYSNSQYATEICKRFTSADFQYHYIDANHNRIMPAKYARRKLRDIFEGRKYSNPDMDTLVLNGLQHSVYEFFLNDRDTCWFKGGLGIRRLQISLDTRPNMLESISHEVGHAIDFEGMGKYRSSSFVSPTHGMTMQDALFEEFPDIEMANDEVSRLVDVMHATKELDQNSFISQAIANIQDMCQAVHGDKVCKSTFGFLTHGEGYFVNDKRNPGTELFAELTSSLFTDRDKTFYGIMKQHCPKAVSIYHEIIEEVNKEWNTKKR